MRSDHPRARDVHALARPPDRGRESRDPPGVSLDLDPWVERRATHPAITPWPPDRDPRSDASAHDDTRRPHRARPPDPSRRPSDVGALDQTPPPASTGDPPSPGVPSARGAARARPPDCVERAGPQRLAPSSAAGRPDVPRPAPDGRAAADPAAHPTALARASAVGWRVAHRDHRGRAVREAPSAATREPAAGRARDPARRGSHGGWRSAAREGPRGLLDPDGGCHTTGACPPAVDPALGLVRHAIVARCHVGLADDAPRRAALDRPTRATYRASTGPPGEPRVAGWPDAIEPRCLSDDIHRERRRLVTVRRAAADPPVGLGPPRDRRPGATSALAALSRDAAQTPPERPPQWQAQRRPQPPQRSTPSPWRMPSVRAWSLRNDSVDRGAERSASRDNPSVPPDASASGSIRSGVARDGPTSQGGRPHQQARVRGRAPARSSYPRSDRGEARAMEGIRRSPVA